MNKSIKVDSRGGKLAATDLPALPHPLNFAWWFSDKILKTTIFFSTSYDSFTKADKSALTFPPLWSLSDYSVLLAGFSSFRLIALFSSDEGSISYTARR
jgi:hypothetical protein